MASDQFVTVKTREIFPTLDEADRRALFVVMHEATVADSLPDDVSPVAARLLNQLLRLPDPEEEEMALSDIQLQAIKESLTWFMDNLPEPDDWPHHGLYEGTLEASQRLAGQLLTDRTVEIDDQPSLLPPIYL